MAKKIYDLSHANLGGGISIFAKNVEKGGDYATLCLLRGKNTFVDGDVLHLGMNVGFRTPGAIDQVKKYLLSINDRLLFGDEDKKPPESYGDENDYMPDEIAEAVSEIGYSTQSEESKAAVKWAERKGYFQIISYTQSEWTQKGVDWLKGKKQ